MKWSNQMSKEIYLSNSNKTAIIDDEMFDELNKYKWNCDHHGYARTGKRKDKTILMHRLIFNPPEGMFTDHINHNTLDNRRSNLRSCTIQQNSANRPMQSNNTSGAKGITLHKKTGKWQAQVGFLNKTYYLGLFEDINEARKVYNKKARELFGDFARLENDK
jgi:hypothetical protein